MVGDEASCEGLFLEFTNLSLVYRYTNTGNLRFGLQVIIPFDKTVTLLCECKDLQQKRSTKLQRTRGCNVPTVIIFVWLCCAALNSRQDQYSASLNLMIVTGLDLIEAETPDSGSPQI